MTLCKNANAGLVLRRLVGSKLTAEGEESSAMRRFLWPGQPHTGRSKETGQRIGESRRGRVCKLPADIDPRRHGEKSLLVAQEKADRYLDRNNRAFKLRRLLFLILSLFFKAPSHQLLLLHFTHFNSQTHRLALISNPLAFRTPIVPLIDFTPRQRSAVVYCDGGRQWRPNQPWPLLGGKAGVTN